MNLRFLTTFILIFLIHALVFGQSKSAELNGDCQNATEIVPTGSYAFKKSPVGYGEVLEIRNNPMSSKYFFTEENNTAWFTFVAKKSSILALDIVPLDIHSDFDFLVFEYTDENFCADVKRKKLKPIRSNISRFDTTQMGVTGLSVTAKENFVPAGIGNNYSKAITTQEGKRYFLVINNVHGSNSPFKIRFTHYTTTLISGTLTNEETGNIVGNAKITWEQNNGLVLAETTSNTQTGRYEFEVPILKTSKPKQYVLTATDEEFNFIEKIVFTSQKDSAKRVELVIPKLILGEKMNLHNIQFYGNEARPLPNSKSSMRRLYAFMKHHKSFTIRIEGHTNGCNGGKLSSQKLSVNRAKTVKRFLVEKGIDAKRIKTIGYGCTHMLYPINSSEEKQSLNRRVEFVIIDLTESP